MNNLMENYSLLEYFLLIILAILSGLSIRYTLGYVNQKWATTYHHTLSYVLLPVITMIITTLIAGNLALSLGMIGALSIVRFRNPVKSPLELVMFFALITIGIGTAVNFKLSLLLTAVINIVIFIFYKAQISLDKQGKSLFSLSFEEGSTTHVMEVKTSKPISLLEKNENLAQYYSSKDQKVFNYRIIFSNKQEAEELKSKIQGDDGVESINITYAR